MLYKEAVRIKIYWVKFIKQQQANFTAEMNGKEQIKLKKIYILKGSKELNK